jgi:hypothetical protein
VGGREDYFPVLNNPQQNTSDRLTSVTLVREHHHNLHHRYNNNNKGRRCMEEVAPLNGVDSTLVLTNPGVQQCNLRHKPSTSLHTRPSVRRE